MSIYLFEQLRNPSIRVVLNVWWKNFLFIVYLLMHFEDILHFNHPNLQIDKINKIESFVHVSVWLNLLTRVSKALWQTREILLMKFWHLHKKFIPNTNALTWIQSYWSHLRVKQYRVRLRTKLLQRIRCVCWVGHQIWNSISKQTCICSFITFLKLYESEFLFSSFFFRHKKSLVTRFAESNAVSIFFAFSSTLYRQISSLNKNHRRHWKELKIVRVNKRASSFSTFLLGYVWGRKKKREQGRILQGLPSGPCTDRSTFKTSRTWLRQASQLPEWVIKPTAGIEACDHNEAQVQNYPKNISWGKLVFFFFFWFKWIWNLVNRGELSGAGYVRVIGWRKIGEFLRTIPKSFPVNQLKVTRIQCSW